MKKGFVQGVVRLNLTTKFKGMKNKFIYTFQDHLKESLKNPEFRKIWKESDAEYLLAKALITVRLKKKFSQREA